TSDPRAPSWALLAVFLHFLELGVDDIVIRASTARVLLRTGLLSGLRFGVHLLRHAARRFGQFLHGAVDGFLVVALDDFLDLLDGRFDLILLGSRDLVAGFAQRFACGVDETFSGVARLRQIREFLVGFGVGFGVENHLLDLGFRQTARRGDADRL